MPAIPSKPHAASSPDQGPLLQVHNLTVEFDTPDGIARAVDSMTFDVFPGETLAIVGESGCGKSITAMSILRLVPSPPGRLVAGSAHMHDLDLMTIPESEMRDLRGSSIAMIFQEPMTSLNPVLTIGYQIAETVRRHEKVSRSAAKDRAVEMLRLVRIPEPERRAKEFPHQLSGGMRQRAMIAMALSCNPQIVIADEPTTALDVTIQAQVLNLLSDLRERLGTAVILITHDLGVVAESADRVIVMYAGSKVEEADVVELFQNPTHPYTRGLLASVPRLDIIAGRDTTSERLTEIPGMVPALTDLPPGCAFAPRCEYADAQCRSEAPSFQKVSANHGVACWHATQVANTP